MRAGLCSNSQGTRAGVEPWAWAMLGKPLVKTHGLWPVSEQLACGHLHSLQYH